MSEATKYLAHTTAEGERWDQIAQRYYGEATLITPLAEANQHLRLVPQLPGGLLVRVPVLDLVEQLSAEDLPPWKR